MYAELEETTITACCCSGTSFAPGAEVLKVHTVKLYGNSSLRCNGSPATPNLFIASVTAEYAAGDHLNAVLIKKQKGQNMRRFVSAINNNCPN